MRGNGSVAHDAPSAEAHFINTPTSHGRFAVTSDKHPRNPFPTVDIIIEIENAFILIERRNPPHGWAIPGGFVDYGESLEAAAVREAKEETDLDVTLTEQFHAYSAPDRDPRHHTISVVFIAEAHGKPKAGDDAAAYGLFTMDRLPHCIVFDHGRILRDYIRYKKGESKRKIFQGDMTP